MASTAASRRSRAPFVILALVAVAAVGGILVLRNGSTTTPAPAPLALPAPITVPTKTATIAPVRHGRVTTWEVPDHLVGLRSIAVGPDGRVWVTEQNRAQVDSLVGNDLTRYEVEKPFPDAGAFAFGWGPDNALWFTGYPGGTLGRVFPDGSINLFAARGDAATTLGVAEGPGDTMWATDPNLGAIVRIGADGTVTPILVSADGGQTQRPGFIAPGTDGQAMWFTIPDTSQVAKVSTASDQTITRYTVPGHVTPRNIVATGDGSFWVTLEDKTALAGVDESSGKVTIVPLRGSLPVDGLNDLALAKDGSLWVTTASNLVLHVSTDGKILDQVHIPGAAYADGITIGPDGTIWVAARDDLITRIEP